MKAQRLRYRVLSSVVRAIRARANSQRVAAVAVAFVALAASAVALASPPATAAGPTNRIEWQGKARFVAGANVPWYNWGCDFGCGASGGVQDPAVRAALDERFARFRATGMDVLRWWMFEPSSPGVIRQIRPGANGRLEVDPAVYGDIDAALSLAESHNLTFVFVLFSGVGKDHMPPSWLNNPAQREQLAAALGTLFARYSTSNRILAWDIFNEPEWQIWNGLASEADAVALGGLIADQIHSRSQALATVGSATLDGIPMWRSVALDFDSPHWYGVITSGSACALCRDYASLAQQFGTNRPVVIGEWDAPPDPSTPARWRHWLNAGYAGAWGWSLFPERTNDRIAFDFGAASSFVQANAQLTTTSPAPPALAPTTQPAIGGAVPAPGSFGLAVATISTAAAPLVDELRARGCDATTIGIVREGSWVLLIPGAPATVNARFPEALAAATPFFVRCR